MEFLNAIGGGAFALLGAAMAAALACVGAWMRSIGPAVTREQGPAFLRNSNGRLDVPGPTQEAA